MWTGVSELQKKTNLHGEIQVDKIIGTAFFYGSFIYIDVEFLFKTNAHLCTLCLKYSSGESVDTTDRLDDWWTVFGRQAHLENYRTTDKRNVGSGSFYHQAKL